MKEQTIPLVGSLTNRLESGVIVETKDQGFINCFPIITRNTVTGQGKIYLVKRLGYDLIATVADSSFTSRSGYCVWSGSSTNYAIFSVASSSFGFVRCYDETGTILGASFVGYGCRSLSETLISNVPTLIALVPQDSGNTLTDAFYYQSGGSWTKITDGDFPTNQASPLQLCGEAIHKDGYMFVMDVNGRIWNSDLNSVTAWTATSYIDANDKPDLGVGLAISNHMIVAFNRRSIQFFQNTGNAVGSPLTRVPLTLNIGVDADGTIEQSKIIQVADTVYFIGYNKEDSARHVYSLKGTSVTQISNSAVDEFLNDNNQAGSSYLIGTIFQHGMTHLVMSAYDTFGAHYMYCIETGVWWRWYGLGGNPTAACAGDFCFSLRKIYKKATDYMDDQTGITMTIQFGNLDQGTSRKKFFHAAELVCDKQSTSGNISISWSDDDYANFSTPRTIDSSTGTRRITRLGSTKRDNNNKRAWKIEEAVNRPFRGESLKLWYTEGTT